MLLTATMIAEHHPAQRTAPHRPPAITTETESPAVVKLPLAQSPKGVSLLLPPALVLRSIEASNQRGLPKCRELKDASKQDDIQEKTTVTAKVDNEVASSTDELNSPELSKKLPINETEEQRGEIKDRKETEEGQRETSSREETQSEETSDTAIAMRTASSMTPDGGVSQPVSAVAANESRQAEREESRVGVSATADGGDGRRVSGHSAAVGEWNSLPILVERLREALELSLTAGCRHGAEPTATATATSLVDFGIGAEGIFGGCNDPKSKKDELKFLEDLLLSDIQTALSRLRETLEHTDIATLAKHGGVSDPTSKLHLLRLVSSLLSRLQVPKGTENENRTNVAQGALQSRRRRATRHTIGVSAEEIAHARKQLEESSANLARFNEISGRGESLLFMSNNAPNGERHLEEVHDKYTKDVINQRQSLRDKNKESRGDSTAYQSVLSQTGYGTGESNVHQNHYRYSIDYQRKDDDDEEVKRPSEEQSQVTKLAAMLRQRAELVSARCNNNNKFTTKKSKIKRANTVDIPSYLKLQAENLGYDNTGCALLRRPINVGDKVISNALNVAVPSFHPKTENDKKFLALISRNNETQAVNAVSPFKSFGYTKTADMSSQINENWNSRFSNIKTAFDKPSTNDDRESKLSPKPRSTKHFPGMPQTPSKVTNKKSPIGGTHNGFPFADVNVSKPDAGFSHAPSSLFRKIERPTVPQSSFNCQKNDVPPPGSTLRDKAKIMFDRDNNVQSQHLSKFKFDTNENAQKSLFPRPPWIGHDRSEGKPRNTVNENGRLDYRLFCKQFAPFIGKNTPLESKKSQNAKVSHRYNEYSAQHKNLVSSNERAGVVDGKISFKAYPEKRSQIQQYLREPSYEEEGSIQQKFLLNNQKNAFQPTVMKSNYRCSEINSMGNVFGGKILRDSASVAVQTTVNNDDHPKEARASRIPKDSPFIYNNAFVQTCNESEQPAISPISYVRSKEEWKPSVNDSNYHSMEDPRHSVLDHQQNYNVPVTDSVSKSKVSPTLNRDTRDLVKEQPAHAPNPMENIPFQEISGDPSTEQRIFQANPQYENYFPLKPPIDNQSQIHETSYAKSNRDLFENQMPAMSREIDETKGSLCTENGDLEEQNIQNQDISADVGVVTRYTCAIGTVTSADVQSDGAAPNSFPSSPPRTYSRSKPMTNDITACEDEIRRHNMLQQSLVRRLQNERTMLNDYHSPISNQPSGFNQLSNFPTPEATKKLGTPRRLELPRTSESQRIPEQTIVTGLLSIPSGITAMSRITALKEQYEQSGTQSKPVQKERSPIPNGVSAMDSSDEYLVSCSSKPSRSIVLSKSESWHQLALSNNHQFSPRPPQDKLPAPSFTGASYPPKPPKPKSPSAFKTKKQYEASSSADSVKRMEDKIRRYFDNSNDNAETKDFKGKRFSSRDSAKGLISLSRSRTMPGICDQKLCLVVETPPIPMANLNSAEVDKVFDDIFEEATRADDHSF